MISNEIKEGITQALIDQVSDLDSKDTTVVSFKASWGKFADIKFIGSRDIRVVVTAELEIIS